MKKCGIVLVLIAMVISMLLIGCSPEQNGQEAEEAEEAEKSILTFARPEDVSIWDPADNNQLSGYIINMLIYDTLVEVAEDSQVVPALATEWSTSEDGKEWTFKLRSGVKFHNGEDFDSQSVKTTIDRFLNETLLRANLWNALESVEAVDTYTVVITLNVPDATLLSTLSGTPILPANALEEKGTDLFQNPIGTGPFTFAEYRKDDRIVLNQFEDYWGENAKVDQIVYLPIIEDSTRLAGLQTGEVDVADTLPADDIDSLLQNPDVEVVRLAVWDAIYLGVKLDTPPFDDIRVRQALSLALNREDIVTYIMQGGQPLDYVLPEGVLGDNPSITIEPRDVAKAKQLLTDAGYPDGFTFDFIVPMGWLPKTTELVETMRGQWEEVGLIADIQAMDGAAFMEKRGAGNYNLFLTSGAYQNADPDAIFQRIAVDGYMLGLPNQELVDAIILSKTLTDRTERAQKLQEAAMIMRDEYGPFITVCQTEFNVGMRSNVTGVGLRRDKITDLRWVEKH